MVSQEKEKKEKRKNLHDEEAAAAENSFEFSSSFSCFRGGVMGKCAMSGSKKREKGRTKNKPPLLFFSVQQAATCACIQNVRHDMHVDLLTKKSKKPLPFLFFPPEQHTCGEGRRIRKENLLCAFFSWGNLSMLQARSFLEEEAD